MAGVLIEANDLEDSFKRFDAIKQEYFANAVFELKSSFRRLKFKKELEKEYTNNELKEIVKAKVYNAICDTHCVLFGVQINKIPMTEAGLLKSKNETYTLAFRELLLAVQNFKKKTNYKQPIIVMLDSREQAHNQRMYKLYREAIEGHEANLKGFDGKEFSPTLNFVDSAYTFGVQLADFVAGALWRGVEKGDKTFSKKIKKKFPTTKGGEFIGYSYLVCT
ncbi:two-component response regulator [Ligilactobacillus equi DPC 6820]|uniref:Two-component response regulator n=2 Tax=Ligilactobacillus equi TaxID=137357 RepID=V7HTD9_9LACO|nr:two-component response regulator [Ligilactobacillus equi DPC 6820]